MSNETQEALADMLDTADATEWVSWLFDLQNELIARGYYESMNTTGCGEHSQKMFLLKTFLETIAA